MSEQLTDIWEDRRVKIGYETAEELAHKFSEFNWRGHPESQADALDDSLETLHWIGSVKVSTRTNRIFDGHLRVKRALVKNPSMPIPVDYYDLSEDEELLALQIHDAITEQAEPIPAKLAALLARTREMTADRPGLGAMLERLKQRAGINGNGSAPPETPTPTETEADRLAKEYGIESGQVWQLGRHIIACLDSTDEAAVMELIGENRVGMVWADPPYGVRAVGRDGRIGSDYSQNNTPGYERFNGYSAQVYAPVIGDDTNETASKSASLCLSLFTPAIQVWWGANNYAQALPNSTCWIVWDKQNDGDDFPDAELAWCNHKSAVRIFRHLWKGMLRATEVGEKRTHPTQKPVALPEWCFSNYGKAEDLTFDPFLGSGISVLAAERLNDGRRVIGCELAPEYIAVTIHRWSQLTGQTPRRVSG